VKRSVTAFLGLVTVAVGLWVLSGSQTLVSTCTLNAHSGGGAACDIGFPFLLLGIALITIGAVSIIVSLFTLLRGAHRTSARYAGSSISTLHAHEDDSLRDVA
jgi:hypothetical protein